MESEVCKSIILTILIIKLIYKSIKKALTNVIIPIVFNHATFKIAIAALVILINVLSPR